MVELRFHHLLKMARDLKRAGVDKKVRKALLVMFRCGARDFYVREN